MRDAILFDWDDTLAYCGRYYEQVKSTFAAFCAGQIKDLSAEEALAHFEALDRAAMLAGTLSLKERFPHSMGATYAELRALAGLNPDEHGVLFAERIGRSVYSLPRETLPGAEEALRELRYTHDLYIYTAGESDIQRPIIKRSGLEGYFCDVRCTERKDVAALESLLADYGLARERTWMVGNSLRSDIAPAVACHLGGRVLLQSYAWAGVDDAVAVAAHDYLTIQRLDQLPSLVRVYARLAG